MTVLQSTFIVNTCKKRNDTKELWLSILGFFGQHSCCFIATVKELAEIVINDSGGGGGGGEGSMNFGHNNGENKIRSIILRVFFIYHVLIPI
jgi:hypothetical protein